MINENKKYYFNAITFYITQEQHHNLNIVDRYE